MIGIKVHAQYVNRKIIICKIEFYQNLHVQYTHMPNFDIFLKRKVTNAIALSFSPLNRR